MTKACSSFPDCFSVMVILAALLFLDTSSTFPMPPSFAVARRSFERHQATIVKGDDSCESSSNSNVRRSLLVGGAAFASPFMVGCNDAGALPLFAGRRQNSNSLYVVTPEKNLTDALQKDPSDTPSLLSIESCLLKLLPVKKPFFRKLEDSLRSFSSVSGFELEPDAWKGPAKLIESTISDLDNKRGSLEPVFNPDDSALMQIKKAERGEQLIDAFRSRLVDLQNSIRSYNETSTIANQKKALLALSEVGELLVSSFPYDVPTEGKFSYLPRLMGRAKVTFSIRRKNSLLGNITIIADGFAAPIAAGNFVDLSLRNFYTQLPIKFSKKRVGTGSSFEVANLPIFGSYNEGFYDPLTAELRRLPFELIRIEKNSGVQNLAYAQGLASLTGQQATLEPTINSKPLLSFKIPGLVAMNHPDKNVNGGSSEFFALQERSMLEEKRDFLDGEYAPFGYIIEGYDLFQDLQPNDLVDDTFVDEWGELNLVKLRRSSFSEVVQASDDPSE